MSITPDPNRLEHAFMALSGELPITQDVDELIEVVCERTGTTTNETEALIDTLCEVAARYKFEPGDRVRFVIAVSLAVGFGAGEAVGLAKAMGLQA